MIKSLYIKKFALIDELEVQFDDGLNIITGQTGAGKSIILGAMNMILGERADTTVIRQGSEKAVAEGIINTGENESIQQILESNAVEYRNEIILRREIRENGSRGFINDTPVTISVLKKVGDFLVDLHGQHDHQLLLNEENHRQVLDSFGDIASSLQDYQREYNEMKTLRKELKSLQKKEQEFKEKRELHRFQLKELDEAELKPDEEASLEEEIKLLNNAEELTEKAGEIVKLGAADDTGIISILNKVKLHLEDLAHIEGEFESYLKEISSARISIRETIDFTERYRSGIEINPRRLEKLQQRRSELNRLQNKYHRTIPELIDYLQEIRAELNQSENFDLKIKKLEEQIDYQARQLAKNAKSLHSEREKTGIKLAKSIDDELARLGIEHANFEVPVNWRQNENGWIEIDGQKVACDEYGSDDIRFYISTNKGEAPRPLSDIASGGEISRVMLSLKSVLAKQESLPVMIFDEIDSGISGEISEKVGRTMRRLAENCQILAITHQPQIAGQAHAHYQVSKAEHDGRTTTQITRLSDHEHIHEVAGLMSGADITDAALQSAEELIGKNTFRN